MGMFGSSGVGASADEERKRLAEERAKKIAKKKAARKAEGAERIQRQQGSRTVLTSPLGLGGEDQTLG